MPEGHTIHRYARQHRRRFAGDLLEVTSPQGRFSAEAAQLNGRRLDSVAAVGKHLFYRWSTEDILHVHLGLFGKFRVFAEEPPPPTDGTRLAWSGPQGTLYLAGATIVRLIDPDEERSVRSRLGPDPLNGRADGEQFIANLTRRTIPIGAALLDQKVIAGIGNVFRAEFLFLLGIHPEVPAAALGKTEAKSLWDLATDQLKVGERRGRIVTVDPTELGAKSIRGLDPDERLYVYKRDGQPCRRCGTEIRLTEVGNRKTWYCPKCQTR